ncbi:MAG: type II secretion system F family protein [Candidatus Berkelbacteria bacterium]|nr:type II secretion system F family protein [Candidatus Berkelbacteria bacterium]
MDINLKFLNRVRGKEKVLFTRALSATISAGLPIVRALDLLMRQTDNKFFASIIKDIIKRLEEGEKFSSALSNYPNVFDAVFIASISSAEISGKFDEVLKELSDRQENEYKLESSIKGAIAYPLFIVFAMAIAAVILLVVVVPKIESVFTESGTTLPLATRILMGTAGFVINYWYLLIIIVVGIIAWVRYYLKTDSGKMVASKFVIHTPIVKEFYVNVFMARFTKTFGMLVKSGVPIIQAVQLSGEVLDNIVYENILKNVSHQLERGVPMSAPLAAATEFPPIVSQMIAVGEQTGKLDEVMASLSDFFEEESSRNVTMITSLLEPILLILVGGGVGTIVFAIIVPLYQISSTIK